MYLDIKKKKKKFKKKKKKKKKKPPLHLRPHACHLGSGSDPSRAHVFKENNKKKLEWPNYSR
jgi:hypothetical protein